MSEKDFDLDQFEKDKPDEFAIVADLLAGRTSAEELRRKGGKPDDDDFPGETPDVEKAVRGVIAKEVLPQFKEVTDYIRAEKQEKENARKQAKINEFIGSVDERLSKEPVLADEPLRKFFRGGLAHLAEEEFGGDIDKALGAVKDRFGKRDAGVVDAFVKAKNPGTGVLENGGGAPVKKEGPDRSFDTGGFGKGARDAVDAAIRALK